MEFPQVNLSNSNCPVTHRLRWLCFVPVRKRVCVRVTIRGADLDLCYRSNASLVCTHCCRSRAQACVSNKSCHRGRTAPRMRESLTRSHVTPIPGPSAVILRLSYSVKRCWHPFLNTSYSLVASDVNLRKRYLGKRHRIHSTHKKRRATTGGHLFQVQCQIWNFIPHTTV